jgi:hypothetical protein
MAKYSYTAVDANGKNVRGVIEADSDIDAFDKVDALGFQVDHLEVVSETSARPPKPAKSETQEINPDLFYLQAGDGRQGPFSLEFIEVMVLAGQCAPHAQVQRMGSNSWVALNSLIKVAAAPAAPIRSYENLPPAPYADDSVGSGRKWGGLLVLIIVAALIAVVVYNSPGNSSSASSAASATPTPTYTAPAPTSPPVVADTSSATPTPAPASTPPATSSVDNSASTTPTPVTTVDTSTSTTVLTPSPAPAADTSASPTPAPVTVADASSTTTPDPTATPEPSHAMQGANGQRYSIPDYLYPGLKSKSDALNLESAAIDKIDAEHDRVGNEIDNDRKNLDTTDTAAVQAFNQKVNDYNAAGKELDARVKAFNDSVHAFNAELERVGRPMGN